MIAVAERPARYVAAARERAIDDRSLEAGRAEEQPFKVGPASRIADGHAELGLWERVREVGADRRSLRDDRVAVLDCRDLPHRIDLEIVRRARVALVQAQEVD